MMMYYKIQKGMEKTFITKAGNGITMVDTTEVDGDLRDIYVKLTRPDGTIFSQIFEDCTDGDVVKFNGNIIYDPFMFLKAPRNPIKRIFFTELGCTGKLFKNKDEVEEIYKRSEITSVEANVRSEIRQVLVVDPICKDTSLLILVKEVIRTDRGYDYLMSTTIVAIYCDYRIVKLTDVESVVRMLQQDKLKSFSNRNSLYAKGHDDENAMEVL